MPFGDWAPRKAGWLYIIEHLKRDTYFTPYWEPLYYRNGLTRYFWTREQAQARADKLNARNS